jgi:hypothetical protein
MAKGKWIREWSQMKREWKNQKKMITLLTADG